MDRRLLSRLSSGDAIAVGILLLVPLIQVLAQPSWIFTPDGFDQWFYHGYFIDLKRHIVAFAGSYYGTRLAWILPGYLAHSIFPTLAANAVLRLFVCWTAAFATHFLVKRNYGIRCALMVALLLCSYADFLAAAGWDYVDGAGIAYSLLCLEEAGAAAIVSSRWSIARAGFSGMSLAAAIHSNLFLLVLIPIITLFCLVRCGKRFVRVAAASTAGFSIVTAALGFISLELGGPFLFFLPSVSETRALVSAPNPMYVKPSLWLHEAWWLVVPFAISLVGVVFVLYFCSARPVSGWDRKALIRVFDACSLPLLLGIFVLIQITASPVMQTYFYVDYLTVSLPITVAALIGYRLEALRTREFAALAGAGILLALLVGTEMSRLFSPAVAAAYINLRSQPVLFSQPLAIILAAGVIAGAYIRPRFLSAVVISASVGFVLIRLGHIELRESAGSKISRESYLYADRTSRELTRLSRDGPLWFWYSYIPGNEHYTSVASTYIWAARLLNRTLPSTDKLRVDALHHGTYVAIMNDHEAIQQEALAALASCGIKVRILQRLSSTVAGAKLLISLVQVTRRETPPTVYTSSPAETTLLPKRELMDYDESALEAHTSRALYGTPRKDSGGRPPWIIKITDPRDHAATNIQLLSPSDKIAAIRVTVADRRPEEPYGPVDLILQNQDYSILYDSGSVQGQRSTIVALSPGTRGIRIALLPNDDGFIRFPEHVTLEGLRQK
ncbi:MAG TPA: hypothetical protein VKX49_00430 [Bryobacteraceae bacterium]|nr:hypothetical protein [Bryobacteraceae bacterium]